MVFSIFKDQFTWNLPLLFVVFFIGFIYWNITRKVLMIKRYDYKFQPFLFMVSLCLLYLLTGSPLSVISHLSFSTHMLQMSLLYFFVPPLILLGIPQRHFWKIYSDKIKQTVNKISFCALILFGAGLFLYHLPYTAITIVENNLWHNIYVSMLFFGAVCMWVPLCIHAQEQIWKNKNKKISYSSMSAVIITPACLLLVVLPFYTGMNPLFSHISTLCIPQSYLNHLLPFPFNSKYDQQFSGLLMFLMHKLSISLTVKLKNVLKKTA